MIFYHNIILIIVQRAKILKCKIEYKANKLVEKENCYYFWKIKSLNKLSIYICGVLYQIQDPTQENPVFCHRSINSHFCPPKKNSWNLPPVVFTNHRTWNLFWKYGPETNGNFTGAYGKEASISEKNLDFVFFYVRVSSAHPN